MPSHSLKNPILVKFKDTVETKLPEEFKEPTNRIVIAGMKLLYSDSTHQDVLKIYQQLKAKNFDPQAIATGMVNLLGLLYKASRQRMDVSSAFSAGAVLLCYVLDDLQQIYGYNPTPQTLQAIAKAMLPLFTKAFGFDKSTAQPGAPNPANAAPPSLAGSAAPQPAAQGAM